MNPKKIVLILALGLACFVPALCRADAIYNVAVNTGSLVGVPNLYLDFQFIDGNGIGDGNATASLSNFSFGGGSLSLPGIVEGGGVSLTGTPDLLFTMDGTDFFQDVLLPFSAGSDLAFQLKLSADPDSFAPDTFTFGILQGTCPPNGNEACVPIADPNGNFYPVLVEIDLATTGSPLMMLTSGASAFGVPEPTVTQPAQVPEPSSLLLLATGSWFVARARRRRAR